MQRAGDFIFAPGSFQMGDDRRHGLNDPDQREDHRDIDPAADSDRGKIVRTEMPEQNGIDDHHAHRGHLGDEHRPGLNDNQPGLGKKHERTEG